MGSIDSDAHVIETPQTWAYMDETDRKYAPMQVTQTEGPESRGLHGNVAKEYWMIDNRVHTRDRNLGYNTTETARDIRHFDGRLAHWCVLLIDVQVLYPAWLPRPYTDVSAGDGSVASTYYP